MRPNTSLQVLTTCIFSVRVEVRGRGPAHAGAGVAAAGGARLRGVEAAPPRRRARAARPRRAARRHLRGDRDRPAAHGYHTALYKHSYCPTVGLQMLQYITQIVRER